MDIGIIYHLFDSCLLYQYINMFGAVQLNTTMQNKVLPLKLNFLCVSIQLNQQTGYEYQKLVRAECVRCPQACAGRMQWPFLMVFFKAQVKLRFTSAFNKWKFLSISGFPNLDLNNQSSGTFQNILQKQFEKFLLRLERFDRQISL